MMVVNAETVISVTCLYFGITKDDLIRRDKSKPVCYFRQIVMRLLRDICEMSYPDIGELLKRDHSTVMYNVYRSKKENPFIHHYPTLMYRINRSKPIEEQNISDFFVFTSI